MNQLVIKQVLYHANRYHYISPIFSKGVNVISGNNGTGKSMLMDFIYFGLGGTVKRFYKETSLEKDVIITEDENSVITLKVEINNFKYEITRKIDGRERSLIYVKNGKDLQVFNVNRNNKSDNQLFSDWILKKLDIQLFKIDSGLGIDDFYINFRDLLRLIYHDQYTDKHYVYKTPDGKDNFVNDSSVVRKIIFEVLTNNSSIEYYEKLQESRKITSEIKLEKKSLDLLRRSIQRLVNYKEIENTNGLLQDLKRIELKIQNINTEISSVDKEKYKLIDSKKRTVINDLNYRLAKEIKKLNDMNDTLRDLSKKHDKFLDLIVIQKEELDNLVRIIETQKYYKINDPNKCPICNHDLEREQNKCICGADIEEKKYLDFFYTKNDQKDILVRKEKTIDTTRKAIRYNEENRELILEKIKITRKNIQNIESQMNGILMQNDNSELYKSIQIKIKELEKLSIDKSMIENQLDLVTEYEKKIKDIKKLESKKKLVDLHVRKIELKIEENKLNIIKDFSEIYEKLFKDKFNVITSAEIDYDYDPMINEGRYSNAALKVPRRAYYYLALLKYSVRKNIPFPRLLLMDTPKNFGIDDSQLNFVLESVVEFSKDTDDFQIILTMSKEFFENHSYKGLNYWSIDDDKKLLIKNK